MNIAHYFTFLRVIIIPLFPLIYLEYGWFGISHFWVPYFLLLILAICELSDLMDGFLARRRKEVTDFGKILDPMADSITRISVLFTFTQGWIGVPLLLVFVFLYREFFISTLRTICAFRGIALAARKSGKIKAIVQASVNFLIVILIIPFNGGYLSLEFLQQISLIAVAFAAMVSLITAIEYIYINRMHLKKALIA